MGTWEVWGERGEFSLLVLPTPPTLLSPRSPSLPISPNALRPNSQCPI
ncbi:MAG: hypothetical protein F6J93_32925 [Oscillatoria sp. SIO1A7]|nr:hypothetical protein [Oscillatoria sp. SIO1A7]